MSEKTSELDVVELQHSARAAREALSSSLARLDDRVKHMRRTAVDATAASGWGIAAACAWWLSFAIDRRGAVPRVRARNARPALASSLLTGVLKTASIVLTGALVYASYRHARRLAMSEATTSAGQLPAGHSRIGL